MGERSKRSGRGHPSDVVGPSPSGTTKPADPLSVWKTIVAIPLALIVFVATAAIMATGFMLWDAISATPWSTFSGFTAVAIGAAAGTFTGRSAADQFVPGYSGKIVFLGFVLTIAAAFAFDPVRAFGRDHWLGTGCILLVVTPLAFLTFWRGIDLS